MLPTSLPAFDPNTGTFNVIIETPKGSRCKFAFDPKSGLFSLNKALPAGMVFPFSFGFIPSTRGGDGDPLDVLMLFDAPLYPGCLVTSRIIGGWKAKGKEKRNDRLLAVPVLPRDYGTPKSIHDLTSELLNDIQEFFTSYQRLMGKEFKILSMLGPREATKLIQTSLITPA
jgi:inorganic pyrophosphatase